MRGTITPTISGGPGLSGPGSGRGEFDYRPLAAAILHQALVDWWNVKAGVLTVTHQEAIVAEGYEDAEAELVDFFDSAWLDYLCDAVNVLAGSYLAAARRGPAVDDPEIYDRQWAEAQRAGEAWVDVPGYSGYLQASDRGRVRTVDRIIQCGNGPRQYRGRVLRPWDNGGGDLYVNLARGPRRAVPIRDLIAAAFLPPAPRRHLLDYIDGNRSNNRPDNLRWIPAKRPAQLKGRACDKLTPGQVGEIFELYANGYPQTEIALRYGVSQQAISARLRRGAE